MQYFVYRDAATNEGIICYSPMFFRNAFRGQMLRRMGLPQKYETSKHARQHYDGVIRFGKRKQQQKTKLKRNYFWHDA